MSRHPVLSDELASSSLREFRKSALYDGTAIADRRGGVLGRQKQYRTILKRIWRGLIKDKEAQAVVVFRDGKES